MAIRIDSALHAMPQRLQDEFRHEVAGTRSGPIAAAVLPLNAALLDRQARIDMLTRQVKQADERGDEAMRRAHAAEARLERMDAAATRLMAILHVERMTDNLLVDNDTPAMATALEAARAQLSDAWREMVDVLGDYKLTQLRALGAKEQT